MGAPAAFEPVMQKSSADCVIASTAMMLGMPYQEVSKAALELFDGPHESGLSVRDVQRIIKKLVGRTFQSVSPKGLEMEEETGVLFVKVPAGYHAVVLFQGVVYDPASGVVWNYHAYTSTRKATPVRLLRP